MFIRNGMETEIVFKSEVINQTTYYEEENYPEHPHCDVFHAYGNPVFRTICRN